MRLDQLRKPSGALTRVDAFKIRMQLIGEGSTCTSTHYPLPLFKLDWGEHPRAIKIDCGKGFPQW